MDNSFIRLYDTLSDALSHGDLKTTQLTYYNSIQLSPNETYLHLTNRDSDISFQGDYRVEAIDGCGTVLADITSNVFIEEFTDSNGINQCAIEYVNIGQDFYGRATLLRFTHTISDVVYYTNPIKITDKRIEKTIRFDYSDFEDKEGFCYTAAPFKQSIRIYCEYLSPENKSEAGSYYQISNGNTISTRKLKKRSHSYICENIDLHTYNALDSLFNHSEIYIDSEKVTDSPMISEDGRKGYSNIFGANFELYKNESEIYSYEYQVFEGFELIGKLPLNAYTLASFTPTIKGTFSLPITIGSGNLYIYDSSNAIIETYTQDDLTIVGNYFTIDITGVLTSNDTYHIRMDSGLLLSLGIDFEGIDDSTTWSFIIQDADFISADFNNSDFLTT